MAAAAGKMEHRARGGGPPGRRRLWERRTAIVGLAATAIAFGPARMAFGMLLPSIRETLALSGGAAGLIVSMAFVAFGMSLLAASATTRAFGAKLPIVAGGIAALAGAGLVAVAGSVGALTLGVVLAAASAGLCWTPFNAVAGRLVRASRRDRVLSVISTGTTLGTAAMGLGALALAWTGADWRLVFGATALGGAAVAGLAFGALPPTGRLRPRARRPPGGGDARRGMAARLLRREAWPMHALAIAFGAVSAVFATFAVDHVAGAAAGASALVAGGAVFLAYGTLGAAGFAAAAFERRAGLRPAIAACFAAAGLGTGALALAPQVWPMVLTGAGLVGASVMVFAALLAVAALRLFPALPVTGLTAMVAAMSVGSVAAPPLAGLLADAHGTGMALLTVAAGAALSAGLAATLPIEG
jgi:predicted MFS family arabinose efflux permease